MTFNGDQRSSAGRLSSTVQGSPPAATEIRGKVFILCQRRERFMRAETFFNPAVQQKINAAIRQVQDNADLLRGCWTVASTFRSGPSRRSRSGSRTGQTFAEITLRPRRS